MSYHCCKYFVNPDCDFPMVNYSFKEQSAGICVRLCVSMHVCPRIRTSPSLRAEHIWAFPTGMAPCPSRLCLAWARSQYRHGATVNALAWHAICLSGQRHPNPPDCRGEDKHTTLFCASLIKKCSGNKLHTAFERVSCAHWAAFIWSKIQ